MIISLLKEYYTVETVMQKSHRITNTSSVKDVTSQCIVTKILGKKKYQLVILDSAKTASENGSLSQYKKIAFLIISCSRKCETLRCKEICRTSIQTGIE